MAETAPVKLTLERVGPLQSERDRIEAFETIVPSFTKTPPPGMGDHMAKALWKGPTFSPEHTRIAVAGGRVVSAVVMVPRMVRFGRVRVPAMTVGPVATREECRKQGFCKATMNDCSRYMERNGYLLAYLQGNYKLYGQFGYFRYMVHGTATVRTPDAEKFGLPGRLRTMTRKDWPAVAKLYNRATAWQTMTAARDRKVWEWMIGWGVNTWLFNKPRLILDPSGRLCGYLTRNGDGAGVWEIVVEPNEHAWRTALGVLAKLAKKCQAETFGLPLQWGDPMTVFLRQVVGTEFHTVCRSGGGPQLKIVDWPALARALAPLLGRRWKAARSALPPARFSVACEIGSAGFTVAKGRVAVDGAAAGKRVWIPQRWLTGLVSGCWSAGEIAGREGVRIPPALLPYLNILFPAGWPYSFRADLY